MHFAQINNKNAAANLSIRDTVTRYLWFLALVLSLHEIRRILLPNFGDFHFDDVLLAQAKVYEES